MYAESDQLAVQDALVETWQERWRALVTSVTPHPTAQVFQDLVAATQAALPSTLDTPVDFSFYPFFLQCTQCMTPAELTTLCAWGATLSLEERKLWWSGRRLDAFAVIAARPLANSETEALKPYCYNWHLALDGVLAEFFDVPIYDAHSWQAIYRALKRIVAAEPLSDMSAEDEETGDEEEMEAGVDARSRGVLFAKFIKTCLDE
jgi:hypothetical protein